MSTLNSQEFIISKIESFLAETASSLLKIKNVDLDKELEQYGFDSISNTEFANKINDHYDIDLMPTVFFELSEPTIRSLADHLVKNYSEKLQQFYSGDIPAIKKMDETPKEEKKAEIVHHVEQAKTEKNENGPQITSRFIHMNKTENNMQDIVANRNENTEKKAEKETEVTGISDEVMDKLNEPIAIIGMKGMFPQSDDLEEFWDNLRDGKCLVTEIPSDRFDWREFNIDAVRWGGFMREVDKFDAPFFGISKLDAEAMDPQHRLFLETAWGAIEDAGYKPSDLSGSKTGVFVGIGTRDYSELMERKGSGGNPFTLSGRSTFMLCNRVSSVLNLHGPCEAIDTACSSSLVAVHKAVESIHIGSSELAIVGGVNVILTPSVHLAFNAADMLSQTGQCRVFDKDADGTVRSEGVAAIILKPYSKAVKDGDHIYALIKASAQNHKGKSTTLTAPNANAEADLIVDAFHKANIDPRTVNYIEAHSTGSKLGDPIEITGLKKAFNELYKEKGVEPSRQSCAISSLKANIGHLETAAGIGALIKVVMSMQHKQIMGVANFKELNSYINLSDSPFYINTQNRVWNPVSEEIPRRAGVSAFGYGGVNAHVILEEYPENNNNDIQFNDQSNEQYVILLSAKSNKQLVTYAKLLKNEMEMHKLDSNRLADIAYTLQVGRDAYDERMAFTASTINEAIDHLDSFINGNSNDVYVGTAQKKNDIVDILESDDGMNQIIQTWMSSHSYGKLLKLWVRGLNVDWNKLHEGEKLHRVSLPTYPFDKIHYWMDFGEEDRFKKPENALKPVYANEKNNDIPKRSNENTTNDNSHASKKKDDKNEIRDIILQVFSRLLCIEVDQIDENSELSEYGVDSIILTQLLQQLQIIDSDIDFETLYNCKTMNDIIGAVHADNDREEEETEVYDTNNGSYDSTLAESVDYADDNYSQYDNNYSNYNYGGYENTDNYANKENAALKRIDVKDDIRMMLEQNETLRQLKLSTDGLVLKSEYPELVRLNRSYHNRRPVFWFHGGFGGVEIYRIIGKNIKRPFYGIQAQGYLTDRDPILGLEEMASYYVKVMKSVQKEGPYDVGGLSMGGIVAYEVARQLQELGDKVNSIVMLESLYEDEQMKKEWAHIPKKDLKKDRMLRSVNLLLGFTSSAELSLISETELNVNVSDDEFLNQLIALSKKKGNTKPEASLRKSIMQLEKLLYTMDVSSTMYDITPLSHPYDINCYYFCNKEGKLFEEEGSEEFFRIVDKGREFDFVEFSRRWKKQMPKLVPLKIESANHFTILTEPEPQRVITSFCERLYSDEPITREFLSDYLLDC